MQQTQAGDAGNQSVSTALKSRRWTPGCSRSGAQAGLLRLPSVSCTSCCHPPHLLTGRCPRPCPLQTLLPPHEPRPRTLPTPPPFLPPPTSHSFPQTPTRSSRPLVPQSPTAAASSHMAPQPLADTPSTHAAPALSPTDSPPSACPPPVRHNHLPTTAPARHSPQSRLPTARRRLSPPRALTAPPGPPQQPLPRPAPRPVPPQTPALRFPPPNNNTPPLHRGLSAPPARPQPGPSLAAPEARRVLQALLEVHGHLHLPLPRRAPLPPPLLLLVVSPRRGDASRGRRPAARRG